jgi:hypothetical protein
MLCTFINLWNEGKNISRKFNRRFGGNISPPYSSTKHEPRNKPAWLGVRHESPPKNRLNFNKLQDITSQKTEHLQMSYILFCCVIWYHYTPCVWKKYIRMNFNGTWRSLLHIKYCYWGLANFSAIMKVTVDDYLSSGCIILTFTLSL